MSHLFFKLQAEHIAHIVKQCTSSNTNARGLSFPSQQLIQFDLSFLE